jgi:hypothetical protein
MIVDDGSDIIRRWIIDWIVGIIVIGNKKPYMPSEIPEIPQSYVAGALQWPIHRDARPAEYLGFFGRSEGIKTATGRSEQATEGIADAQSNPPARRSTQKFYSVKMLVRRIWPLDPLVINWTDTRCVARTDASGDLAWSVPNLIQADTAGTHRQQFALPLTAPETYQSYASAEPFDVEHFVVLTLQCRPHAEHVSLIERMRRQRQARFGVQRTIYAARK